MSHSRPRVAVLLTLAALAGCSCGGADADSTPTPMPTPVVPINPTYEVQRGEVVHSLSSSGRITPVRYQGLTFGTSGDVEAVYVEAGDWVEAGQLLAELETDDLQNQIQQNEISLQAIELANERQIAEAELSLWRAELNLAQAMASDASLQVEIAEVNLERADARLFEAQAAYQGAVDAPWIPDDVRGGLARALRDAELDQKIRQAEYEQALQAQEVQELEQRIHQREVELARMRLEEIEIGTEAQRAQLDLERLQDQLADMRLVAPFDGHVLFVNVRVDQNVNSRNEVMGVGELGALEVSVDLGAEELQELEEAMPVTVVASGRPGEEMSGTLRRLPYPYGSGPAGSQDVDSSTRISLDVDPAEVGLELHDLVQITVVLERKAGVLWLPPQALRRFEGRDFVVVQEADGQRRVDVKLGVEGGDRVEIVTGLTEGQIVVGP